jgi:hypothetical protein
MHGSNNIKHTALQKHFVSEHPGDISVIKIILKCIIYNKYTYIDVHHLQPSRDLLYEVYLS